MYSKLALTALLLATAEARFGQEQSVAQIISSLSNFGSPGVAPTLAGSTPGVLLAGANACDKVSTSKTCIYRSSLTPSLAHPRRQNCFRAR